MSYTYRFPRPSVTTDCVVFGLDDEGLSVLLIQRGEPPFKGRWALPGGFVQMDEGLETAARRELQEETGIDRDVFLEQLYTFGEPARDPRTRVISVAYYALVRTRSTPVVAGSDASNAQWFLMSGLPKLAFDHDQILDTALKRLQGKIRYQPIGFELLPEKFTMGQLRHLYEHILGREIDKRNFRRKILSMGILQPLDEEVVGAHRPAQLYRFDWKAYQQKTKQGFLFEI